jgi:hypothetical protein
LNGVLDGEIISECSSDNESVFDCDYTQLVTAGTHALSDTESDNGTDERHEVIVHVGLGGVSSSFVWENIDSFPASQETFCNVYGPQFDTAELVVVSVFENIFDIVLVQLIVDETNKYAQQEISKSIKPRTFSSRIRKWEDVTVDKMYVVLALFMLTGIVQKPTLRSYYAKNHLLFTPYFPKTLPLERLELIIRFMHFADNSKQNEYQGPSKLFKIFPAIRHLNNKFQTLYLLKQNIVVDKSLTLRKSRFSFRQFIPLKAAKFCIKHMNSANLALAMFGLFLFILEKAWN